MNINLDYSYGEWLRTVIPGIILTAILLAGFTTLAVFLTRSIIRRNERDAEMVIPSLTSSVVLIGLGLGLSAGFTFTPNPSNPWPYTADRLLTQTMNTYGVSVPADITDNSMKDAYLLAYEEPPGSDTIHDSAEFYTYNPETNTTTTYKFRFIGRDTGIIMMKKQTGGRDSVWEPAPTVTEG